MDEVGYLQLLRYSTTLHQIAIASRLSDNLKNDELRPIANAFVYNVSRLTSLIPMPLHLMHVAAMQLEITHRAFHQLCGTAFPNPISVPSANIVNQVRSQISRGMQTPGNFIRMEQNSGILTPSTPLEVEARNLDEILVGAQGPGSEGFRTAVSAFLSAMVINAYTAFESLSTDLWVAAVNMRPHSLAVNVINKAPIKSGDALGVQASTATIPLEYLLEHKFNLSRHMGDILKERNRVSLESLNSTQKTYAITFLELASANRGGLQESKKLTTIFEQNNKDVGALEAIRNLIAHRGGIVDQKFLDLARKYSMDVRAQVGDALNISGEVVEKYSKAAIDLSIALLQFVDGWLHTHTDTNDESSE